MTQELKKSCEECGKPELDQALIDSPHGLNEYLCLDCARLQGVCLSCGKDIRALVDDYFMYDQDICPNCIKSTETL